MIRDGVHQINIEDWKVLERGVEGVSIVSQTTNNRKGAIPEIAVSKKKSWNPRCSAIAPLVGDCAAANDCDRATRSQDQQIEYS